MTLTAILGYVVAAISGGTIWKVFDYWLQHRKQDHDLQVEDTTVARQLRDELRHDLESLRTRVDTLEKQVDTEREARLRAELNNQLLLGKIDLLIRMVNELRARQGLQPITADEILPLPATFISNDGTSR